MTRWLLPVFLVSLQSCLMCGGPPGPTPDQCTSPSRGTVDALEVGHGGMTNGPFTALAEGEPLPIVWGFQGGTMVGVRLRIEGAALPECLAQSTRLSSGSGAELTRVDVPLRTYESGGTSRLTETLWLVSEFPPGVSEVTIRTQAGGSTVERRAKAFFEESCAQMGQCRCYRCQPNCGGGMPCEATSGCAATAAPASRKLLDELEACLLSVCGPSALPDGGVPDGGVCPGFSCHSCRSLAASSSCGPTTPAYCGKCATKVQACLNDRP